MYSEMDILHFYFVGIVCLHARVFIARSYCCFGTHFCHVYTCLIIILPVVTHCLQVTHTQFLFNIHTRQAGVLT